jgi:hypothetical protein
VALHGQAQTIWELASVLPAQHVRRVPLLARARIAAEGLPAAALRIGDLERTRRWIIPARELAECKRWVTAGRS